MTTNQSVRSLERDSRLFVFRNNRLLIGWHTAGALRTEAWIEGISQEEANRELTTIERTGTPTDRHRVYTTSDGFLRIAGGVKAIQEPHPALLFPGGDRFLTELGLVGRVRMAEMKTRLANAGLMAPETFNGIEETRPTGSGSTSSERSAHQSTTDSEDMNPTPGSGSENLDRDTSPSEQSVHQSTNDDDDDDDDVYETFGSDFEMMVRDASSTEETTDSVEDEEEVEPADGPDVERMGRNTSPSETAHSVDYEEGVEPMERLTLKRYAAMAKSAVIFQARAWADPAMMCNINLRSYLPALSDADSTYDIVELARQVLVRMDAYREELSKDFRYQVRILEDAEARIMPESILTRHRETVMEYKRYEYDTRTVYMNLKTQIEDVETRRVLERYGAIDPLDRFMDE
jgi:hypothetical protein